MHHLLIVDQKRSNLNNSVSPPPERLLKYYFKVLVNKSVLKTKKPPVWFWVALRSVLYYGSILDRDHPQPCFALVHYHVQGANNNDAKGEKDDSMFHK